MSEFIEELKKKSLSSLKKADRFCQTCQVMTQQEKPHDSWVCTVCNNLQISL